MKAVYPAVFELNSSNTYTIEVPDLDIVLEVPEMFEAMEAAREAVGEMILYKEDQGKEIPKPSKAGDLDLEKGEFIVYIDIDSDRYRKLFEKRSMRKNITLPVWLNEVAEEAGVNFSQVLQEALKEATGIYQPKNHKN